MAARFRWIIPLLVLIFFDWYGFQVIKTVFSNPIVYWIYWSVAVATYILAVAVLAFRIGLDSKAARMYVTAVFFMLLVFKLLLSVFALTDDLVRVVKTVGLWITSGNMQSPWAERSVWLCTVGIALAAVPLSAMLYGMLRNPYRYKIQHIALRLPNLPEGLKGFKIVQISDIHTGSFTTSKPLRRAVGLINDLKADAVFFTGDLVNNYAKEALPYIEVFSEIKARYGVFSILGNHDYGDYAQWPTEQAYRQNFAEMKDIHRRLGWNLLLNSHHIITHQEHKIAIIGVENWSASPRFKKYGNLPTAYKGAKHASLKLLLSHDPSHWREEVLPQFPEIAATFSGHTHAFQFGINLPFFKWSPVKWMYKEWYGLYEDDKQFLYVNPGFGFVAYPGRVGFRPEITVFELHPLHSDTSAS